MPLAEPGPLELLSWRPGGWTLLVAVLALLYVLLWRRREGRPWAGWRVLSFGTGLAALLLAAESAASSYALNSMALYMTRLMLLAEVVPPLLVLAVPAWAARSRSRLLGVLLDPWVALAVWTTIIVVWNLPFALSASLVSNSAATLLPALYLLGGLLTWAVTLGRTPTPLPEWRRAVFGLLASVPMMLVGLVWLFARDILYTPYVSALCLWNLTPLDNQQLAGVVMLVAGVPLMLLASVQLGRALHRRLSGERSSSGESSGAGRTL